MAENTEYGSVLEEAVSIRENTEGQLSNDDVDLEGLESVAGCNCQSQCTRKLKFSANGKVTGCPCKGYGLLCGDSCSCGSGNKTCKNKAEPQRTEIGGPNREPLPREEISVEVMIDALDHETLVKVAKQGFMTRELQLQDLINSVKSNPGPSQSVGEFSIVPPFCVCGCCHEMSTDKERICCRERRVCRSRSGVFRNICLDGDSISTAIRSNADTYVFTPTYDNRATRHSAYRQYVMWQHGHLGKGHRKVIPACCIWEIRKHYPSPDGRYTGYEDK